MRRYLSGDANVPRRRLSDSRHAHADHPRVGNDNAIVKSLTLINDGPDDGRTRYSHAMRAELYAFMRDTIRRFQPDLTIALCLESRAIAEEVGVAENIGKCNCIL